MSYKYYAVHPSGYRCHFHPIGYHQYHMVAVSKVAGLIISGGPGGGDSDERLWQELERLNITTPRLRHWMPYLHEQMLALELIRPLYCHGMEASLVACTSEELDEIVQAGLRGGYITIN